MSEGEMPYYTADEVKTHNTKSDLWVIIDSKVYDLTDYVAKHPGGREAILRVGGTDITELFVKVESHINAMSGILKKLPTMLVGNLRK